jgi:hypothetical protein
MRSFLAIAVLVTGGQALALTPPPPCEGSESGMQIYGLQVLDPETGASGVTVESYQVSMKPDSSPEGVYRQVPPPVDALDGFFGIRVTHCPSGTFHAINTGQGPETVAASLAATEFLRDRVKDGKPVGRGDLASAVRAVYGKQITLRETEETCGCSVAFPDLKPKGMTPYAQRTDTTTNY